MLLGENQDEENEEDEDGVEVERRKCTEEKLREKIATFLASIPLIVKLQFTVRS